jgi:uncharacterized protein (UPF0332 family)
MDKGTKVIIGIRVGRSQEELAMARVLIEQKGYRLAVSRSYYAMFYLTTAALLAMGIYRGKHSAVRAGLHQFLVQPGLIEPEYGKLYDEAFDMRHHADYDDFSKYTEETARQLLADAERYVARLETHLRSVGAID